MRPMIRYIKERYKKDNLIGVEIGLGKGTNALSILKELPIKTLYLIDPYFEACYNKFYNTFKSRVLDNDTIKDKIEFIRKASGDTIDDIPNDLDFVYLDGSNEYEDYYNDIKNYYDKIRIGGIIGGQIGWKDNIQCIERVKAMADYMERHGLIPIVCDNEFPSRTKGGRDWWILKD